MTTKEQGLIRRREWYKRWSELIKMIESGEHTTVEVVQWVFGLLDGIHGFGSRTKADFSKEALDQALKDEGLI